MKWSEMSTREAAAGSLRLYFRPARSPLFWVLVVVTTACVCLARWWIGCD